jgi:WD40 repeat protein
MWDPLLAVLHGHSDWVWSVTFSFDGSRLASASSDKTVQLWDGATGASIATLEGHSERVLSVTFSSDGSRLASASSDKTVRLWDGATGAPISSLNNEEYVLTFPKLSTSQHMYLSLMKDPLTSLSHIVGSKLGNTNPDHVVSLCCIHDFHPMTLAYTTASAAVGCHDGHILLFDIQHICFDFV